VREIGPLHKRFSAIVGPNGSGKSNVIDALLFVFGRRAKKLRCLELLFHRGFVIAMAYSLSCRLAKVSELIHRSSAYIDLESARVSVYFQEVRITHEPTTKIHNLTRSTQIIDEGYGDDDFEVVPRSEFVISRMALKNNSSKYQIDERNSTFAEVTELLLSHGVDLDNNRCVGGECTHLRAPNP
jgi:structural maintenance of chromosome 4